MSTARYQLVDAIAHGGMGDVWRAWDERAKRYVAAKVLRHGDATALLRFVREQSLRVAHPHVVAPSGWAADDERVLLTMDLVRGGSVHHLLRDYGSLPVPYVAVLLDQLLDALTAVHAHGIVHRDITPANLLLEVTGRRVPFLRLSDFGIAVVRDEPRITRRSVVLGTPGYVAPEVVTGAEPDPRQDLYLVGVLGVELLTGSRPTGGPGGPSVTGPTCVPEPMWSLLAEMMRFEPADRPASAAQTRRRWRELIARLAIGPVDEADPDAIEVFDHVGELPPGFGPRGPGRGSDPSWVPTQQRGAAEIPSREGSSAAEYDATDAAEPPAGPESATLDAPPPPPRPRRTSRKVDGSVPTRAAPTDLQTRASPPFPPGRRPRRIGTVIAAAGAMVVGVVLIVLAISGVFASGDGARSPGRPSVPDRSGSSTAPGVARLGAACGDLAGVLDTTTTGTPVVCRPGAGGRLVWQRR